MKTFRAILANIATVLSLLLMVASIWLWIRSYRLCDCIRDGRGNVWQSVMSARGQVIYLRARSPIPGGLVPMTALDHSADPVHKDAAEQQWLVRNFSGFAGFAFGTGTAPDYLGWAVIVPLWFPTAAFATFFVIGCFRFRRRWRRRNTRGICANCGYDLRATPERCPECGTTTAKLSSPDNVQLSS